MPTQELSQPNKTKLIRNKAIPNSKDRPLNKMSSNTAFNPFNGPQIERVIYTTESQSEIWTDCLIGGEDANKAYIISTYLEFKGSLDINALEKAIETVIKRHESLRSVFSSDGVFISIFENIDVNITHQDVSTYPALEKETILDNYLKKEVETIFDFVNGPLIKFGIIKLSDLDYQFVTTTHHIICDGWSMSILLQEISSFYSAYTLNINPLIEAPINFSNYADELHTLMESNEYKKTVDFWVNLYEQPIPIVDLPTDYIRPSLRTYKSNRINFQLNKTLIDNIKLTSSKSGSSFVSTLISAFEILLYQLTGQTNLALGLPTSGQSSTGMTQLVGHCVNLLPLRTNINPNISFLEYLKLRKNQIFDAYEHDKISFGHLLQKLPIARDASRIPLVPVVINFESNPEEGISFEGLTSTLKNNTKLCETFEIFLNTVISKDSVRLEWSYKTDLFNASTIENMMVSFEDLLESFVSNPSNTISNILNQNLSAEYNILNQTQSLYPKKALHELILAKALETEVAKHDAIVFNGIPTSYENLFKQVNKLSHYFVNQGIKNGDIIGVSLPRCQELPMVLLAIMQCGAIYLPLDPAYPQSRLEFMLEDSEAKLLITNHDISASFPKETTKIYLDDVLKLIVDYPSTLLNSKVEDTSASYILYTSGSTGKPKGVTVTHKNLVNFLYSMANKPGIKQSDKLLSITTISFDIAGLELFLPLLTGATLVIADDTTARDGRLLHKLLIKEGITMLQATPTTWQMLLDSGWKTALPLKALCGGEALPLNLAQGLLSKCDSLWNMYGPTETTIWSSVKQIHQTDNLITIGKPIANTQMYLLNEQEQLMAPGTVGEICIGGDGVALGYLKRPELTSEKFIENPFNQNNSILYKTGDLGKLLPSGEILCLGRIDQQVKVRGHRIELGEIEQALTLLDDINMAVVLADSDMLTAYVVASENLNKDIADFRISEWKNALKTQLPPHLIPNNFNLLDRLPSTLNGKIDRKALLAIKLLNTNKTSSYTAPRTNSEEIVSEIWQNCLGLEKIDVFSNFFELGGHSLIAVKVMRLLEEKTGKRLPLSALFEYSTIEKLAELLSKDDKAVAWDSLVPIKPEGTKTPLYIVHGAGLNVLIFNAVAKHLPNDQPVYGLQAKGLNGIDEPLGTIEEIAAHYINSIVKVNPDGPYALAGYSFGGLIAYEMAHQMISAGKKVTMVGLLDTYLSQRYYHTSPFARKMASAYYKLNHYIYIIKEIITSKKHTKDRIKRKKESLLNLFLRLNREKMEQQEMEIVHHQQYHLDIMNQLAMSKYHIVPRQIELDVFRVKEQLYYMHDANFLGWKNIGLKGVHVHEIPGDHNELFSPPNDKESALILQNVLDQRNAAL
jgi:amino acid adenylation domain-containing protein